MRRPVIFRLEYVLIFGLLAHLYPATSRSGVIVATRDPQDDREVVRRVAENPRVVAFRREADAFRKASSPFPRDRKLRQIFVVT